MKRLLFSLFLLVSLSLSAQVRFGLKGGVQLAQMEFNVDALRSENRVGFFVGPTLKIELPISWFTIDAAALYDQRDLKVHDDTFRQKSLVLQGNARIGAGISELACIFIQGGPQFSFNVGDDVVQWVSDGGMRQFALQETMLSFNLGLGVAFAGHFEAGIHYNIPMSKTGDFNWSDATDTIFDNLAWSHAKSRTNAWSLALSYYF